MNIALIIAGGSGHRMHQDIPKQFINVYDEPVIVYTLEAFERHPEIDAIEVVCIDGWHDMLRAYAKQFGISKLKWVTSGGNTAQESIRNGVFFLADKCSDEDIIIGHFSNDDNKGLMITNVTNPDDAKDASVTLSFNKKYKGVKIFEGEKEKVLALNGDKITVEVKSGKGLFIVPLEKKK